MGGILMTSRLDLGGMIDIDCWGDTENCFRVLGCFEDLLWRKLISLFRLLNFLDGLEFLYCDIAKALIQLSRRSTLKLGRERVVGGVLERAKC
jgi:hypothetical protein